jgi:DNA-binding MarR family transcriptional regulator
MRLTVSGDFIEDLKKRREDDNYNSMMRIMDISKLHRDFTRSKSDQDGLPSSYRMLLFYLSIMEPGVTQLQLVKAARLKPPTVSVTLQKMENDGLVTRQSNEHDLRQTLVFLTEKGKSIIERIHATHDESHRISLDGFTEEECCVLNKMLDRIIDNLIGAQQNK